MAESKEPRIPEVGEYVRMHGVLVETQVIVPKVETVIHYIFEETEARIEARINGKLVKKYSTFNDFYGKGRCVSLAIDEASQHQAWLGESNLEFVVVKITSRRRKTPTRNENFYAKEYREFESLKFGSGADLPDDIEVDVWSSSRGFLEDVEVDDAD